MIISTRLLQIRNVSLIDKYPEEKGSGHVKLVCCIFIALRDCVSSKDQQSEMFPEHAETNFQL